MVKKGLGKGLAALFEENPVSAAIQAEQAAAGEPVRQIAIADIIANPNQPRKHFDAAKLNELADSLRAFGMVQPLVVSPAATDGAPYQIVAGERRFRAAKLAGLESVPCIVRQLEEKEIVEISLIENIQREDLNILEEAQTYQRLLNEYGYTQAALAKRLGKSRPHIANTVRLLGLDESIKTLLRENALSAGHGRAILMVENPKMQAMLAKKIVADKLSVRQAEALAHAYNGAVEQKKKKPAQKPVANQAILADIEKRLRARLATQVKVQGGAKGGRILIEYYSDADLERVLEALFPDSPF